MLTAEEQLTREGVDELEPLRFQWLVATLLAWALAGVAVAAVYYVYSANRKSPDGLKVSLICAAVAAAVVGALRLVASSKGRQFYARFDVWRDRVIRHLDNAARFSPSGIVHQSHFDASGLNSKGYNAYTGGNHLAVNDMQMSYLSVVHRYKETYYTTDSQGQQVRNEREVVTPVFNGTLLVLPAALPHAGWVILQPRQAFLKSLVNSYATDAVPRGLHKLTVASPELNDHYSIGTSDQFVGHRVLTPSLMVSLWDYRNQFKHPPRYSYKDNLLYILLKDISIGCGGRPTKWAAVTLGKLGQVVGDCRASINFLKRTAASLRPT